MASQVSTRTDAPAKIPLFVTILFLLVFSGPPKFRVRESAASLYGELDFVLILQIIVWLIAGIWIARKIWSSYKGESPPLNFGLAHVLTLVLITLLTVGTVRSVAPALTIFKVYQLSINFFFCLIFVENYGIEKLLDLMLVGYLLLCSLIGVCAIFVPDFVFAESETGMMRLEGRLITEGSTAAAFAFILLLGAKKKIPGYWLWLSLSGSLLLASLTRNAWAAVAVFLFFAIWKRPRLPQIRLVYTLCVAVGLIIAIGGFSEIDRYRDPANIYTLSDRLGLWAYMSDRVMAESPAIGLGYVAGTRMLGPEYNPDLGSGHSIFFEVFVGGGISSLAVFLLLIALLGMYALRSMPRREVDATAFTVCALFFATLLMGSVGGELDSTPYAFTFWGVVTAVPLIFNARNSAHILRQPGQVPLLSSE